LTALGHELESIKPAFNQGVPGSIPGGPTIKAIALLGAVLTWCPCSVAAQTPRDLRAAEYQARLQDTRAEQTDTPAARRASAAAWLRAGNLALDNNEVRFTCADGLAAFGRPEARAYYRRAYELRVNEAGPNKYVIYLLDQRDPAAALAIIESLSDDERRSNVVILSQWRRALQQAGRDTRPADTALAEMERRSRGAQGGVFLGPIAK
jgi:hypothetical protein